MPRPKKKEAENEKISDEFEKLQTAQNTLEEKINFFISRSSDWNSSLITLYNVALACGVTVADLKEWIEKNKKTRLATQLQELVNYSFLVVAMSLKIPIAFSKYMEKDIHTEIFLPKFNFDEDELKEFKNQKFTKFTMNVENSNVNIENLNDEITIIDDDLPDDIYADLEDLDELLD